ncbi:MAG: efflux RND transporter permease subunit, partial [Candidatus Binatia bacterium]
MPKTSGSQTTRRLAEALIDHRLQVVIGIAIVTAVFGYFLALSQLAFNYAELLPQRHPFIQTHNKYGGTFGESNTLVVMLHVTDGTVFTVPTLTTLVEITHAMERLPGVNHDQINSLSHRTTRWLQIRSGGLVVSNPVMLRPPVNQEELERIEHIVVKSQHIYGVMVSLDKRSLIVRAGFHERLLDYPLLFEAVNREILGIRHDPNLEIFVVGMPRLYGWIYQYIGEILLIFLGTIVLVWILLYLYFRDWRGSLRPTISGGLAAVWGLGFIRMIGFSLDPLTLIVPFFITARAVSHSVQMHDRYYEELGRGRTQHEAIVEAFAGLFVPTLSGILTDALGVLVILLVPIVALQKLAVAAAFWIMAIVVSELLLNPIIYHYLRPPEPTMLARRARGLWVRSTAELGRLVTSRLGRWVTVGFAGLGLSACGYFISGLTIGDPTSVSNILRSDHVFNVGFRKVQEQFGGVEPLLVVVEGEKDALKIPANLRTIQGLQRYMEGDPSVGASFSLVDILTSVNMTFHEMEPKWGVVPRDPIDVAGYFFLFWTGAPPSDSARYFAPDFSSAHITLFCRDHQVENVRRMIARAETFIAGHTLEKARFRMAGGLIGVLAAVYEEVLRNNILMNVLSFGTIFLICAITYRSIVAGALLMVPMVIANSVINAYMGARGIGINLNTLPVVTVGVGFGIDYGIYILSRVAEEVRAGRSTEDAVVNAITSAGRAVTFTGLTMIGGVVLWVLSSIRFEAEMG